MRFNIEERKALNHDEQWKYISDYHTWLEEQRKKDSKKYPDNTERGRSWLRKKRCPYCYKKLVIKNTGGVTQKSCKKHGLLQVTNE